MNIQTKFFVFHQNNSGGSFIHDPKNGIGYAVWVEAVDAAAANARAELIGLYFNGCADGIDCNCCGDRWYETDNWDSGESPLFYGRPWREAKEGEKLTLNWGIPSYIHKIDGSFKPAVEIGELQP